MSRCGTRSKPNPWTQQELVTLVFLPAQKMKYAQIALHLPGRSIDQCARRHSYCMSGHLYNAMRRSVRKEARARIGRPPGTIADSIHPRLNEFMYEQRLRRLEACDARDISAAIFGDPPKEFSALDLRERANT